MVLVTYMVVVMVVQVLQVQTLVLIPSFLMVVVTEEETVIDLVVLEDLVEQQVEIIRLVVLELQDKEEMEEELV